MIAKLRFWCLLTGLTLLSLQTKVLAATISVPYRWTLNTSGKTFAQAIVDNPGPANTTLSGSDTLSGLFNIGLVFTPPTGYIRLDPLPTTVGLNVVGSFTGDLSNGSANTKIGPVGFDSFVTANASFKVNGTSQTFSQERIGGPASGTINQSLPITLTVGRGSVPFSGNVSVATLYGAPVPVVGSDATGNALLQLSANLINPTGSIRYQSVPEPFTILGSGLALGVGALMEKKYSRKRNKLAKQRDVKNV